MRKDSEMSLAVKATVTVRFTAEVAVVTPLTKSNSVSVIEADAIRLAKEKLEINIPGLSIWQPIEAEKVVIEPDR